MQAIAERTLSSGFFTQGQGKVQTDAMTIEPPLHEEVVAFWREAGPDRWFTRDDAFDAAIREQFHALHLAAARAELDDWCETAQGALALILLLDQFPRNLYRGSA